MYTYPPKWQIYAVLLAVFSSILWFIPSPERWWTFGLFAAILGPVTFPMLTAKKPPVRNNVVRDDIEIDYIGTDDFDDIYGYVPGLRDFGGGYHD
jgi:phenylalanine-4-hydroxylase